MNKSRTLAAIALGICVGLAGIGQGALASRSHDDDDGREEAAECSTEQSNGDNEQSGLVNLNNINVAGNLLCDGLSLDDILAGVLGSAEGGDEDGDEDGDESTECSTEQSNDENEQSGLVNVNNLDVAGNALCGGILVDDLTVAILGDAEQGDDDGDDDEAGSVECSTEQSNEDNEQSGLVNANNAGVLSNGVCGGVNLDDIVVSILGFF